jgi:uncharacterized membrane protein YesL
MRGLRIVLKALSDTFEHLLPFTVASVGWWLGVVSIIFGPGATLQLFRVVDPRVLSELERPTMRNGFQWISRQDRRSWILTAVVLIPVGVLMANLSWSGESNELWTLLIPIWMILLISFTLIGLLAFSIISLYENSAFEALRIAAVLAYGRPSVTIPFLLALAPVALLCIGFIVPVFLFLPALLAAAANRLVFDGLGVKLPDPLAPSDERRIEELKAQSKRKFGP